MAKIKLLNLENTDALSDLNCRDSIDINGGYRRVYDATYSSCTASKPRFVPSLVHKGYCRLKADRAGDRAFYRELWNTRSFSKAYAASLSTSV